MSARWRWMVLAVAVAAAGCSIDRVGRRLTYRDVGGGPSGDAGPGMDGGTVVPPDVGVDAGLRDSGPPPPPCPADCGARGSYCQTSTGTCICPENYCCAGCDTPGYSCDKGTWFCECNDCRCRGCTDGLDCDVSGACVMPPPPLPPADCGRDGQPCCPGDQCLPGNSCRWHSSGERCDPCGNDGQPCCNGSCNRGICGLVSRRCYG